MTVPCFTLNQFIDYIKSKGWDNIDDRFWEKENRLVFTKAVHSYVFQCKDKYFYPEVVQTCWQLGIDPPDEHSHCYYQHYKMFDQECYCKRGLPFKDCCGKQS